MRAAGGVLVALLLAGCAGQSARRDGAFGGSDTRHRYGRPLDTGGAQCADLRHEFHRRAGGVSRRRRTGGRLPGNFYTSRHWTLDKGALTINDQENQPLAHLTYADGRFEGKITAGTPVTLGRPPSIQ